MKQTFTQWLAGALICGSLTGCLGKNFHEIDPGRYYRSAQLTGPEFQAAIDHFKIKTIINLRGSNPKKEWYQEEKKVADLNHVNLISIPMSSGRLPNRVDLIKLLDAFRNAERPLLVHCQTGADRTGEASALYAMLYMGQSKSEAMEQLSLLKFHHSELFKPAKDYFIRDVWQGESWAYSTYDPCKQDYKYYDKKKHCKSSSERYDQEDESRTAL